MKTKRFSPSDAFTLTELLIVIAIVGILASLASVASARSFQTVRAVSCLSNLRQWGIATHSFADDNADSLPFDGAPNGISERDAWYVDLPPAIGLKPYHQQPEWRTNPAVVLPNTVWLCPSNKRRSNGRILFHYCLNRRATVSASDRASLSSTPDPGTLVWLYDNGQIAAVAAEGNAHPNAHGAGAQFLFLDGHVQRLSRPAYWDQARNRPRPDPQGLRWTR